MDRFEVRDFEHRGGAFGVSSFGFRSFGVRRFGGFVVRLLGFKVSRFCFKFRFQVCVSKGGSS